MNNNIDSVVGLLSAILVLSIQIFPTKQQNTNNICLNEDSGVSQFRRCSDIFIGKTIIGENNTELKCPKHSLVLLFSIHQSFNEEIKQGCKIICSSKLFLEHCKRMNNSCVLKSSDILENFGCHGFGTEIQFLCFKMKTSALDEDFKRRNISFLCNKLLHPMMKLSQDQRSHLNSSMFFNPQTTNLNVYEDNFNQNKTNVKMSKREVKNISMVRLYDHENVSENLTKTDDISNILEFNTNKSLKNNYTIREETFLGKQISLWFSSINEPQLINMFIKSNLEKFILYVVVFVCVGVMSVMAVVIYSLAYQIKHKRTYMVNKNNQQKPGKITYHSPNNWRTPDSGSSTGDDRTLHEDEVNALGRTDSRHVMCSSMTETRSARELNQLSSSHQPLNTNSVRGSTTLPSPPNSLIFERASPLAPNEGCESPREKPNTPSHSDFAERLSP